MNNQTTWALDDANLDNIQLQYQIDRRANFMFKAVHLETHAFEHNFGSGSYRYLFEKCVDRSGIQSWRK